MRDDRKDQSFHPEMPPVQCGLHLVDYLWEWGPSLGDAPLNHAELKACQENTGVELSSWDASTLVLLSKAYLGECYAATKRDSVPPYGESDEVKRDRAREQARMLDMFLN